MHNENSIEWVRNLENLSEEQWRTPIAEGKWTIAEVIGHLPAWDQFILDNRIPYLFCNQAMPKAPVIDELNHKSSLESQSKTKGEVISKFITVRRSLIIAINNLADDLWETNIYIGKTAITLADYLRGSVKHDLHHFRQVQEVIEDFEKLQGVKADG